MLVDGSYDNLLQGISQQPAKDRQPGQSEDQLNMVSDPVSGLGRRSPAELINTLSVTYAKDAKYFIHDLGTEQYIVGLFDKDIRVWALDGTEETFDDKVNKDVYLASADAQNDFSTVTIGDYTLIANKQIYPDMTLATKGRTNVSVAVFTSSGEHEQHFTIEDDINGPIADWKGPAINATGQPDGAFSTEYAVAQLELDYTSHGGFLTYSKDNNLAVINNTSPFEWPMGMSCSDGHGANKTCWAVEDVVSGVDKLPVYGYQGQVVTIEGERGEKEADDFHMEWIANPDAPSPGAFGAPGVWKECLKPGHPFAINALTMPHALIRKPNGNWIFANLGSTSTGFTVEPWINRLVGDDNTNPLPSFIGSPITGMGVFQERLYLLHGDTITMSSTRNYFDFFYKSALAVLDSDPIDYPIIGDVGSVELKYAVTHNRHLVIFTDFAQFIQRGDQPVTPETAHFVQTTAFKAQNKAHPVTSGDVIFFPINYGTFSGIQEFYTTSEVDRNNARTITEHVKRFIPGDIIQLLTNESLGYLMVRSTAFPATIYTYKYIWEGAERVQSAWSSWTMPGNIRHMFWQDAELHVLVERSSELSIVKIDTTDPSPEGMDFNIYLDLRDTYTPVNAAFTFSVTPSSSSAIKVVGASNSDFPGMEIPISSVVGNVITLVEDPGGDVFAGYIYPSLWSPTMPHLEDSKGHVIETDRLTLNNFIMRYKDTGYFEVSVNNPYYDTTVQEFTGRILGGFNNIVGEQPVDSGEFRAAIRRNTKDTVVSFYTITYLPMTFLALEWAGQWNKRGRRL